MKILLVDNGSLHLTKLQKLLSTHHLTTIKPNEINLESASEYNLVVLSGGSNNALVNHLSDYGLELELVKNCKVPIIGICLGFEIIAFAYGCKIRKLSQKQKGVVKIEITKDDPIFIGLDFAQNQPKAFEAYESHSWVITMLSPVIEGLAETESGFEIIKHSTKPIYGFQFHPEVEVAGKNEAKATFLTTVRKLCNHL